FSQLGPHLRLGQPPACDGDAAHGEAVVLGVHDEHDAVLAVLDQGADGYAHFARRGWQLDRCFDVLAGRETVVRVILRAQVRVQHRALDQDSVLCRIDYVADEVDETVHWVGVRIVAQPHLPGDLFTLFATLLLEVLQGGQVFLVSVRPDGQVLQVGNDEHVKAGVGNVVADHAVLFHDRAVDAPDDIDAVPAVDLVLILLPAPLAHAS